VSLARALLAFWLTYYSVVFFCAPYFAYKSYVTYVPDPPAPARSQAENPAVAPQFQSEAEAVAAPALPRPPSDTPPLAAVPDASA
jgi:hypothetical protein